MSPVDTPDNSYTASDDSDYEESPLPTYSGASDTAGQSNYVAPVDNIEYAAGSADNLNVSPAPDDEGVDALYESELLTFPLPW